MVEREEADGHDSESEDDTASVTDSLIEDSAATSEETKDPIIGQKSPTERRTSVVEDVIQRKGVYGRFAEKWFSKKGWSSDKRRMQGMSSEEDLARNSTPVNVQSTVPTAEEHPTKGPGSAVLPVADKDTTESVSPEEISKAFEGSAGSTTVALLPKILRTTKMYFASGNFFFSYDYDLTRGIGQQISNSSVPLFKQADPLVGSYIFVCILQQGAHFWYSISGIGM